MPRKKGGATGSSEIVELRKQLAELAAAVRTIAEKPVVSQLPIAQSPEQILKRQLQVKSPGEMAQAGINRMPGDRNAVENGLQPDTVVRYLEGSTKAKMVRENPKLGIGPDKPLPLGVVLRYMYTTRQGERKYKVEFPGVGKDGCKESELEVV